ERDETVHENVVLEITVAPAIPPFARVCHLNGRVKAHQFPKRNIKSQCETANRNESETSKPRCLVNGGREGRRPPRGPSFRQERKLTEVPTVICGPHAHPTRTPLGTKWLRHVIQPLRMEL